MRIPFPVWFALLLLFLAGPSAAEDVPSSEVYERNVRSFTHATDLLESEALRRDVHSIHVAFDGITFSAPPGRHEYRHYYRFARDVDGWLDALTAWAADSERTVHAFSTLREESVEVGAAGWRGRLEAMLAYKWFDDPAFRRFEPASAWVERWLKRTKPPRRSTGRRMLVLLTSNMTPEQWSDPERSFEFDLGVGPGSRARSGAWRRTLLPVGTYWREEVVGAALAKARVPLLVVAPEGRFEDHSPLPELPSLPWASRPAYPPVAIVLD
ncbi:MAG: hypothetical protein ACYTG6_12350, partial [Planctomycetota bacterium]